MSMPSDVTADITEAMEQRTPPSLQRASRSLLQRVTAEQAGYAAAAVIAFLGVAVIGPKIAELRRPRRESLSGKMHRTASDARRRADAATTQAGKRLRQLGGGTIRR